MSSTTNGTIKDLGPFENERLFPGCNDPTAASLYPEAIADVRKNLGKTYPLFIDGKDITPPGTIDSVNPAQPEEIIGRICQASCQDVETAIQAANAALPAWRGTPAAQRAMYLVKCADILRKDIYRFSAWQVLEEGKQWAQAYNDLAEAIDFLEYYAREIIDLAEPQDMGSYATEANRYFYESKGIAAVISPWNFPLAIGVGMVSAAIVAGCPVVFKPSNQAPVVGHHLVELFKEVGLPKGVFNFVPGRGSEMGDYLVDHPLTAVIAFTGSMEVGLRIIERAGKTPENQVSVKKVISEMGGKNAVVIDDDTDIDSAVPQVLYSAFGFQGQKCSACSRLIVVDEIYDAFIEKLIEQAKKLKVAPAEDPESDVGPVIDASAQKNILAYADLAEKEGKLLYRSPVPDTGYYVPITIAEGITPDCRLAQEEVFGPVLAVMRAKNFDQAIEWANSTRFALTGAVFSRKQEHLDRATREFRVGNLYLNRACVGAQVKIQPFGGFHMSGVGTKAGGPAYLLHFMDPRSVTEQPMA
ncbi:MAG: L-glutamate gamma-semialdehyde dehydrogenase [Planctomycetes bacterium]|nr:L-glutamate gamma-semialdehyde dehydrogenase [Planctomycetota bacterium]